MLENITWTQYAVALIGTMVLYYAAYLAFFYRHEIQDFLRKIRTSGRSSSLGLEDSLPAEGMHVMGATKPEPGFSFTTSDQLRFAPDPEEGYASLPLSQIPEVLQELRSICEILETEEGGREDLQLLLQVVTAKYPDLVQSDHLPALQEYLRDQLPFDITPQEMDLLWPV